MDIFMLKCLRCVQILQMFQRKVHPEHSTGEKEAGKQQAEAKKKTSCRGHNNGNQVLPDEDILIYPQRTLSKKSIRRFKSQLNPPHFTLTGNESCENKELWIKTDADCKCIIFPIKKYPL
ncbi:hypothetical protein CDL15_Pgr009873 [Punica granatum]|uniref:Uncharacterized protein n=1 Tax=Punica granatum TaxID=22663 RepID=A0A218WTP1_PUNGR|nr:hypothetical protein CDL15_Pgr009873 [Punica granatum]